MHGGEADHPKGHVFGLDFERTYQSWDRPPHELFHAGTVKTPTSGAVISHLKQEGNGCSHLLLLLDGDREGENICFEVMHVVLPVMRPASGEQRVWRARFSAVSAVSIAAAMEDLREPNEHEASAVDARQELDLKVGVAFTRFLTHHWIDGDLVRVYKKDGLNCTLDWVQIPDNVTGVTNATLHATP